MAGFGPRRTYIAAAVLLMAGFGGGFLVARLTGGGGATPQATAPESGVPWPFFGKLRNAGAPRAAGVKPDGFGVWTTRLDLKAAGPSACVRMTKPLDPGKSYGDFVTVSPDLGHPPALTVEDDELCVAGVGYDNRTITLLTGFPALGGDKLFASVDVAFQAGAKPVYVGFSGTGVILPREDGDGLGVETVNVSRLQLEVWRVSDRNLVRKEISAPDPTPEGEYDDEGGENGAGDDGRKVFSGDMDVHGGADQRTTTVFALGSVLKTLEPGAYVVTAKDASGLKGRTPKAGEVADQSPARARRWILYTDMALQAYDGADALDVVVRSLKTAKAMSGVKLALIGKDGGDLGRAVSDGEGRVRFARALLAGEAGAAPARLMAYGPGGDFTVMNLDQSPVDLSKQDVQGRSAPGATPQTGKGALDPAAAVDGFVYVDRGVYRPGETVHLVALLRDRLARTVKDRSGTLVIRRPSGLEYSRLRFPSAPKGAATQDLVLPAAAPRGLWKASLEMDGSQTPSGQASFQVEDFVPQRLAVALAAAAERPLEPLETRPITVTARFLYGAVASALPVRSEARVIADPAPFPSFKDYQWGDQQTPFGEKLIQGAPSVTDGAGRAQQAFVSMSLAGAAEPLLAVVTASVFEPGGRPVSEEARLKLREKSLYLGVKATSAGTGEDPLSIFDIIAVNGAGRRVAAPKAHVRLIAEHWTYDWFEQNGRWGWRRSVRDIPISDGALVIGAAAPTRLSRHLPWGDYRIELTDQATGARTVVRQSAGWAEPADGVEPPDAARVSAVRANYRTGDTVEVHIAAPFAGEAQIAVATDRLIATKSVTTSADGAVVRLRTDAAWGAGAYILVTVVQPRDPVSSPKPRRALGLVYIPLDTPGRKLTVSVQTPDIIDSKAPVDADLAIKGLGPGERAHVTLAAVDEGVLRLTHQKNPDPALWYFGKRALGLAYRDDYGRLLDPNLGAAGAVHFGGDEFGGAGLSVVPTKTVALWSGVVETDVFGRAKIHLPPGDFNGQLRLVAVAWTDKAVGSGSSELTVRAPVVTELSLPRFLAPGDRAEATLELDNVAGRPGAYRAEVSGAGLLAPETRAVTLAAGQRIAQSLVVAAPDRAGVGAVELKTKGPNFTADRRYPLQTRLGWGAVTHASSALQQPGESYSPTAAILTGFAAGDVAVKVSYSPFRNFDPAPIAEALRRYPYGCSEQLTSLAVPLLYNPAPGGSPGAVAADAALARTVSALVDREALDGSFGLWRVGDGEADPWLGGYIVDFLLAARAHGAQVPEDALQRAVSGLRLISRPDGFSSIGYLMEEPSKNGHEGDTVRAENARRRSRAAAYALYDMTRYGQGDLARLRWFHDVGFSSESSPLARAQIGAALEAMGDKVRAHDSFVEAVKMLGFRDDGDIYQSPLRDLAGVIALAYEAGEVSVARSLQGRLETTVKAPDALNTQEQAHLLKAASAMRAAAGPLQITAFGVRVEGQGRFALPRLEGARLINTGHGAIWRTVTVSGTPISPPKAESAGLRLEKRLFSLDGAPVDPAAVAQGARVIVRLAGRADQARSLLAVVDDPLPAGLEIEAVLTEADAQGETPSGDANAKPVNGRFAFLGVLTTPSLQEKRDDRFIAAMTLADGKPFAIAYIARAVTPGEFFFPGASARDMYHPAVGAQTAAGRLKVVRGR